MPIDRIITSHGNTSIDNSTENTARLLHSLQATQVEVVMGSRFPLAPNPIESRQVSAGDFVGVNGICDLILPENTTIKVKSFESDPQFLQEFEQYLKSSGPVDYIVTGPLTNLAKLYVYLGADIYKYIRNVYIMGGALYSFGNTGPELGAQKAQIAEFNIYCDPLAAHIVNSSDLQKYYTTWDLTKNLTISYEKFLTLKSTNHSAELTKQLMEKFFHSYGLNNRRQFEFNDPFTVLAAKGYGNFVEEKVLVDLSPANYGKTTISNDGRVIHYHVLADLTNESAVDLMLEFLGFVN